MESAKEKISTHSEYIEVVLKSTTEKKALAIYFLEELIEYHDVRTIEEVQKIIKDFTKKYNLTASIFLPAF